MAVWCIGCFAEIGIHKNVVERLVMMLEDRFPQVRSSACVTLGIVSPGALKKQIPRLVKALKDGSINRDVICSSINLIAGGHTILISILGDLYEDSFVAKSIIRAFRKVEDIYMDAVLSETLKHSKY